MNLLQELIEKIFLLLIDTINGNDVYSYPYLGESNIMDFALTFDYSPH